MKIKTGLIVKVILASLFIWYISYGIKRCHEEGDVVKYEFNEFNPRIYDLPFNIDSITNTIVDLRDNDIKYIDINNMNRCDFEIDANYSEISFVYSYRNKPEKRVREYFYLSVTLFPLTKELTRVTVSKTKTSVQYGVKLWQGPEFEHYWFNFHDVETPVIQEYDFIRLLGKQLGYL